MKIVSLLENTANRNDVKTEHGLSLYIETEDHKILFDMGQTDLFCENAKILGIDLSAVDIAILSHGHYDHGGGLKKFMEINSIAPIFINKYAFLPYYNGTEKYIGLDENIKKSKNVFLTGNKFGIDTGLTLYSCNRKNRKHGFSSFGLNKKAKGEFLPDDFLHEHYLLIKENGKKVLISGCSHKGILNITEWFEPDVLVGGFHFCKMETNEELAEAAKTLNSFKTTYYTCHCTGTEQFLFMKNYMDNIHYLSCGETIYI